MKPQQVDKTMQQSLQKWKPSAKSRENNGKQSQQDEKITLCKEKRVSMRTITTVNLINVLN